MESKYMVLNFAEGMRGDYANEVCTLLESSELLNRGCFNEWIKRRPNNYARLGTQDSTVVNIYLDKNEMGEPLTFVVISRSIQEPVETSEERIIKVRKELSSKLKEGGLMIH